MTMVVPVTIDDRDHIVRSYDIVISRTRPDVVQPLFVCRIQILFQLCPMFGLACLIDLLIAGGE